mgnify:CR=1 FL=1
MTGKFAIKDSNGMEQYFGGLAEDKKRKILDSLLTIYICEGEESEIKEWFETINIAGVPLNAQELLNALEHLLQRQKRNLVTVRMQIYKSGVHIYLVMQIDRIIYIQLYNGLVKVI